MVYLCTVCAVVSRSTSGERVLMGIDIRDSWESTSKLMGVTNSPHPPVCMSETSDEDDSILSAEDDVSNTDASQGRVFFDAGSSAGKKDDARKGRKESARRKAPMPRSFQIASSAVHVSKSSSPHVTEGKMVHLHAYVHTTAVDVHLRPTEHASSFKQSQELRVLLQARHPNII